MKLIARAADYGMLDCLTDGCLKAIRDGILRDVAFITNNPSAERAGAEIVKFENVSVGQEVNFVSGWPSVDPKLVPSLVNPEGRFWTSRERQAAKRAGEPLDFTYEDALIECESQVQRFIKFVGRKPSYISGHSFGNMNTRRAIADIADKYGILIAGTLHPKLAGGHGWYRNTHGDKTAYTPQIQAETDVEAFILEDRMGILGSEYGMIGTHCGYCDEELMHMSTVNIIRAKELYALTSPRVRKWVEDNNIELINMDDFIRENTYENQREVFLAPKPEWSNN